jgi:uncharacterized protein YndB with AHSA1/START domain
MDESGKHRLVTTMPSDLEIVMTRVFDAPRELVFEAHTSCEHLSNWWGPRQYEVVECDVDFRPGGKWRVVHRGGDGTMITFFGEYLEIVRPEKIVWTFGFDDNPGGPETYTFEEHDGKTTITSSATFPTKELRDQVVSSGMEEGAAETYDRLDEYLEVLGSRANR